MNDLNRTADEPGREQVSPIATESVPSQIGRYRIERVLGKGGFGIVYLAHDDQLRRLVAIKVPHVKLISRPDDAEAYLSEARTVANLDHPNIVPVYDVGSTNDCPFFVVSKFIEGSTLSHRIKNDRPTVKEAVELVASVAETLQYAHRKGLVHRDIKPGNILLDKYVKPFVADFGLALRDHDVGKGPRYAGTPAYMSPEQARGEGHRVDGRSDIFSLGVVFYELLVGRRPFRADSQAELLEQVTNHEPRPLRQMDERIPKELERICFKALSKRAAERYMTALDMTDDLRYFQAEQKPSQPLSGSAPAATPVLPSSSGATSATPTAPVSDSQPLKIVPKGLRSFDAPDADFFLELLPGPRDREGLPDSIRFWKTRIEEKDADNTFSVGLIYGPSGCGKSSLVKAGLLPRLAKSVTAVYVEATAAETEAHLLKGLRRQVADLASNLGLIESLAALRRGRFMESGQKVLLVLDQFEQWLHAKRNEEHTELVQALRQCDGGRVQCVVMVRDDFWLTVSRFMKAMEVEILEGRNSALVDLFDPLHARKVLAAFGRAYGRLPDHLGRCSQEQDAFLDQAVAGLAQEGKVISVRLALFAEMVKGKPWTPATLKEVGGAEGVGVTFLEETFTASTAPPQHRLHQKAAQAVLKALLPEAGTDIKGHMRSQQELLEASGYVNRLRDFDGLRRILDSEIRLITPTDPEGHDAGESTSGEPSGVSRRVSDARYYQLTHDYLVPSLRDWLTRKQKETRRGRAELLLADRAAVWTARPENRQLPSLLQWFQIKLLTAKKNWTPPQRKMMRKAGRYHAVRGLAVALILVLVSFVGWEGFGRLQAQTLRDRLQESTTVDVPGIVKDMAAYRRWVDPLLHDAYVQGEKEKDSRKQLHASLALLPVDSGQVDYLYGRLLQAEPREFIVLREALQGHQQNLTEQLWAVLENPKSDQTERFRASCALAAFAPDDPRWEKAGADVAATLVSQEPFVLAQWMEALKGAGRWLMPTLAGFVADEKRDLSERGLIARVYGAYAADVPDGYARLEKQLVEPGASVADKIAFAKRQANIGALLVMGRTEKVWPLLKHQQDLTLRSFLMERLGPMGVDAKVLLARLEEEQEVSVKRAILLSLGEYGMDRLQTERRNQLPRLLQLYRDDPDPGIHSAAEWLLRQWGMAERLQEIDQQLAEMASRAASAPGDKRQWYVNRQAQTMVIVPGPVEFWMGEREERHKRKINRSFAIASKEVTVEQFLLFRKVHPYDTKYAPTVACPVISVSWYDAAAYCNWLSEQEGIAKEQWCYVPNEAGAYAAGMTMARNYLQRTGYRLPTEAEWEYAWRAGSETDFPWGEAEEVVGKYAWIAYTADGYSHVVGLLKPNDLGLWDMHGNVWEWVQDAHKRYPKSQPGEAIEDKEDMLSVNNDKEKLPSKNADIRRVCRGSSFRFGAWYGKADYRFSYAPWDRYDNMGFRPSRTLLLGSFTALPPAPAGGRK